MKKIFQGAENVRQNSLIQRFWLKLLLLVSHPAMLLPIGVPVALYIGRYTPEEITRTQAIPIFIQGSSDWGGSNIFAASIVLYVLFGILGAWYLTLRLAQRSQHSQGAGGVRTAFHILRTHIVFFVVGGIVGWSFYRDTDDRNMFLLMCLLYSLNILVVVKLSKTTLPLSLKLGFAPVLIYCWVFVGWDGNTAKAGWILGQEHHLPRSTRHAIMLAWHHAVNSVLGDSWSRATPLMSVCIIGILLFGMLYVLACIGRFLKTHVRLPLTVYWGILGSLLCTLIIYMLVNQYMTFHQERLINQSVAAQMKPRLRHDIVTRVSSDPCIRQELKTCLEHHWSIGLTNLAESNCIQEDIRQYFDTIFESDYWPESTTVSLYIPLKQDYFLFVWQKPSFRSIDVRKVTTQQQNYHIIQQVLQTRHDYQPSFFEALVKTGATGITGEGAVGVHVEQQFQEHTAVMVVSAY